MFAGTKLFLTETKTRLATRAPFRLLGTMAHRVSERELRLVEFAWRGTRRPSLRRAAVSISWLGNGALYFVLALVLLLTASWAFWPTVVSVLSIAIAHIIYPPLKAMFARRRPYRRREEMVPLLATLDEHSFPSGHVMTLSAASVPIIYVAPLLWPGALFLWLAMAWARIASAHHYPSDVVAGGVIGGTISWGIALVLLR